MDKFTVSVLIDPKYKQHIDKVERMSLMLYAISEPKYLPEFKKYSKHPAVKSDRKDNKAESEYVAVPAPKDGCGKGNYYEFKFSNRESLKMFAEMISLIGPVCSVEEIAGRFSACKINKWTPYCIHS